jgi:hypothetical protein
MRIGFDLDGTVADMQAALVREARRLFPGMDPSAVPTSTAGATTGASAQAGVKASETFSTSALTASQQRELWNAVCARENFWEELQEIEPGSLARLYELSRQRRWEVIFLTSRPESAGDTAQAQSHRWLVKQGFLTPSVFVVHGSRGKISSALALDVFVDDRPENCLDISIDSQTRAILVWRDDEDKVPGSARQLGIGAVPTVAEVLDILENLDRKDDREGLIGRFKRLLGLQSKSKQRPTSSFGRTAVADR